MHWVRCLRRLDVTLLLLGACSELLYILSFAARFPLIPNYRANHFLGDFILTDRALVEIVAAFSVLFVLYVLAWWRTHRRPWASGPGPILGIGGLFLLTMSFVYPITAPDIYKYIAAGRILFHYHRNPMLTPPSAFPHDPILLLADGIRYSGAPYGPLGILADSFPTLFTEGSLLTNLLLLKLLFSVCVLADAYLAYRIVSRLSPRHAPGAAVLIAWNPLIVFQAGSGGHNDSIMLLLALFGFLAVAEGKLTEGPIFGMVSALVKYGTLSLVPLFVAHGAAHQPTARRRLTYLASLLAILAAIAVLAYAPFWQGLDTFRRSLQEEQAHQYSFSATLATLSARINTTDAATLIGRLLFVPVFGLALWLSLRTVVDLVRGSALALLGFLALAASTVRPWYAMWPMMLAAISPMTIDRVAGVLLTYGAAVGGLLFAYGYALAPLRGLGEPEVFPYVLTFAPPVLVLTTCVLFRVKRAGRTRGV
jgi:hypothetical protein